MNILAIDYGAKHCGLALVNTDLGVVLPYGQVKNQKSRIKNLVELIKKENIDRLIVGLPLGLDGQENENTKHVRAFVEALKSDLNLPVEFADERFTTAQADRMGGDVSVDEKAAMLILQTYLDKKNTSITYSE